MRQLAVKCRKLAKIIMRGDAVSFVLIMTVGVTAQLAVWLVELVV